MIPFFVMNKIRIQDYSIQFSSIRVEKPVNEDAVLVFLHEALGSIPQWKSFPERLCETLRLNGIVYERRGHGGSDNFSDQTRTENYLHQYAFEELPAFLSEVLSNDQKVILVGHSDGGTIALLFAAKFPKKVKACITMAAHVINEKETLEGIHPAIQAFETGKLDGLKKFHGQKTTDLFYAWARTWLSKSFKDWNITKEIKGIECPVIAIQGEKDQYGTPEQLELIEKSVKSEIKTFLVPNCGHHPHLEKAEEIVKIIAQNLQLS